MITTNHKRSVGIFSSHQAAENALNELRDDGFAMSQVSVIAQNAERLEQSNRIGETQVQDLTDANHGEEGAKTGAATGGVLGGLSGLLVGLGTLAIPGVGPVMLAGAAPIAPPPRLLAGQLELRRVVWLVVSSVWEFPKNGRRLITITWCVGTT